jgi:hypothetical protein
MTFPRVAWSVIPDSKKTPAGGCQLAFNACSFGPRTAVHGPRSSDYEQLSEIIRTDVTFIVGMAGRPCSPVVV